MKKVFHYALCAIVLLSLAACGTAGTEIEMIPVKSSENSAWSFITPDGNIVFDEEFENEPTVVIDGVFSVREKDGIALYTVGDGKPEPVSGADELLCCGMYSEGLIPIVRAKERITVIDRNGKTVFTLEPVKGKEIVGCDSGFSDGLLRILDEDGKFGYVDKKGKAVIEPQYYEGWPFSEGLTWVRKRKEEGSDTYIYSLIDKSGKVIKTLKEGYVPTGQFHHGRMAAKKDEICGFIDNKGEFSKLPKAVEEIYDFNKNFIIYGNDYKYGVMTIDGEIIVKAKYDKITFYGDNQFLANNGKEKNYLLDKEGKRIHKFDDYDNVESFKFSQFGLVAGSRGDYNFLNDKFEEIANESFYDYGIKSSVSLFIESDYFDVSAVAVQAAGYITKNGIGGITLGESGDRFLKGEAKEADNTMFSFRNNSMYEHITHNAHRYSLRGYAVTDEVFYEPHYTTTYETYFGYSFPRQSFDGYRWNRSAKADALALGIRLERDGYTADVHKAIEKQVEKKGFKSTFRKPGLSVLKQGSVGIAIIHKKEGNIVGLIMLPAQRADEYTRNYSAPGYGYDENDSDNKDTYSDSDETDDEDMVVAVDSEAVDEN